MLDWKDASDEDLQLKRAFEFLLSNHPKLLDFLFDSDLPRLKGESAKLLEKAKGFSSGEQTLIRVTLDLWDGSGNTLFSDVIENLDRSNKKLFFITLQYLKKIPAVGALCLSTIKIGASEIQKQPVQEIYHVQT